MPRETKEARIERMTRRERECWELGVRLAGVDEAGRGPLAGPVVAACVAMPPETLNIKNAARLAMKRAIEAAKPDSILVDAERDLDVDVPQEGIVHGDAECYCIAAASIVAKVTRDRMMLELDREYPQYGFAQHKGYGTAAHYEALRAYGPCPAHRRLFIRSAFEPK